MILVVTSNVSKFDLPVNNWKNYYALLFKQNFYCSGVKESAANLTLYFLKTLNLKISTEHTLFYFYFHPIIHRTLRVILLLGSNQDMPQLSAIHIDSPPCYRYSEGHDLNCPLANVTCEYCNMELIREQMLNHYNLDCPKAPVPCTFSAFGCPEKMQRNDLAMHLQDYTQAHMRMMAQTLRSVSTGLNSQVSCIDMLSSEVDFQPATLPGPLQASHLQLSPPLPPGSSASCDCSPLIQNLKETVQQLEGRLVRQDHQIRELTAKMETQNGQVADLKRGARTLEERLGELEAQQCNGTFIWKVENFNAHLQAQAEDQPVVLHSPGFYTGKPGYKLCLRLHLQTPSAQRCSNYISLFVHTMQGEYDSYLPWPFQGTIRLSILDQSEGPVKHNHEEVMESKPELLAFQRPFQSRNPKGFGYVTFLHLKALGQRTYVKDDMMLVRCEVVTRSDLNWMRKNDFQPRSAEGCL
ncbi:TNF receptor-associated factor 6 isoform X2 [Scyliorhinus canicula]|uniref:TNF receptor-associated factor 6 isoform X2 n=1 Tax=Scyliorhinus canicula TaxID=7830 RepID=UPI0018F403AD|nr:TNF receptor-associated factor 6 isoform X2 [Scyliorhinus canicula]